MISLLEWGKVLINLIALNSFAFISKTCIIKIIVNLPAKQFLQYEIFSGFIQQENG